MFLDRFLGGSKKTGFECVYRECESLCCKKNLAVLNEDDLARFDEMGLNEFLEALGTSPMNQLEGLRVLQLQKDGEGNCVFLNTGSGGCKIYANRPYYCREFPFKFALGRIKKSLAICPGVGRGDELEVKELKNRLGSEDLKLKPPYIVGDVDEGLVKTARTLMSAVFRLMK